MMPAFPGRVPFFCNYAAFSLLKTIVCALLSIVVPMSRQNQWHNSSRFVGAQRQQPTLAPKSSRSPPAPEPQRKPSHRRPNAANQPTVPVPSLRTGMQDAGIAGANVVSEPQIRHANTGTIVPRAAVRQPAAPGYASTQYPEDNPESTTAAMNSVEGANSSAVEPHLGYVAGSDTVHPEMAMPLPQTFPQLGNQVPLGMNLTQPMPAPPLPAPVSFISGTTLKQADILRDLDRRVTILENGSKSENSARQKRQKRK